MPPKHEDKKYCVRGNCPFPGTETVETFVNGIRENALIMCFSSRKAYERILVYNGYKKVETEDTENFAR